MHNKWLFKVFLSLVILVVIYVNVDVDWSRVAEVSVWEWVYLFLIGLLIFVFLAVQLFVSLRDSVESIKFTESFLLAASNGFLNSVFPMRLGLVARGAYLRLKYGLGLISYSKIMLLVALYSWLGFLVFGLFFVGVEWKFFSAQLGPILEWFNGWAVAMLLILILVSLVWFSLRVKIPSYSGFVFLSSSAIALLSATRLCVIAGVLGENLSFGVAVFLVSVPALVLVVSITPGNVGVKEVLMGVVAAAFGLNVESILLVLLVDRVASYLVTLSVGGGAMYMLLNATTVNSK